MIKPTNDRLHATKPEQANAQTRQMIVSWGHLHAGRSALRRRRDLDVSLGDCGVTEAPPEILFERRGAAGLVTLNRPQALNAVTLGMVRAFTRQLQEWRDDPGDHARRADGRGRARVLGRRRYPRALRRRHQPGATTRCWRSMARNTSSTP